MASGDHLKGSQPLPLSNIDVPNGKYYVASSEEKVVSADGPEYQYLKWFQTPPLDPTIVERLHSLQLFAESHDQGFCDTPSAESPKVKDDIQLTWLSHVNRLCTDTYDLKRGKIFRSDHDIFRLLEDGNVIAVRLCARFSSWELSAKSGQLLIEIDAPVSRQPLSYGHIATHTKAMQQAFLDINTALLPDTTSIRTIPEEVFTAEMVTVADNKPLRVLALDGGGVRGVAALILLDAVMQKFAPTKKPHEVFDMIGGTSTGGFIAIMLGRFKMSIADCLTKYEQFMNTVFPPGTSKTFFGIPKVDVYSATTLENVIKGLVKEQLKSEDALLMDDQSEKDSCKVFVVATKQTGANNSAPVLLRSYKNPLEMSELPQIKIWQAARATSAAPMYFTPMTVDQNTFVDGGLEANNPLGWLWNEVLSVFGPARNTNCFLSIGTGTPLSVTMKDSIMSIPLVVPSIATNSEVTNILFRTLINAFAPQGMAKKYWRFNVGDGFPDWVQENGVWKWKLLGVRQEADIGELDDVKAIQATKDRAYAYLKTTAAGTMLAEAAQALK